MRIRQFHLHRYGHFADQSLDFSREGVKLWLVWGENEAGKTTLLSALREWLFGMHPQTPYAFRHGYGQLLLEGEIETRAGERLCFRRRKGRQETLLDAQGRPLPDGFLGSFLGPVETGVFQELFALDHAGLREGGKRLMEAKGAMGEAFFQAVGGFERVMAIKKALTDEMGRLLDPRRRSNSTIRDLHQQWRSLAKEEQKAQLSGSAWQAEEKALQASQRQLGLLRQQKESLLRERHTLERVRRLAPLLARYTLQREWLQQQEPLPELPAAIEENIRSLAAERAKNQDRFERLQENLERLETERSQLPSHDALVEDKTTLDTLYAEKALFRSDVNTLESLQPQLALLGERKKAILLALQWDERLIPPGDMVLKSSRKLLEEIRRLQEQRQELEERLAERTALEAELPPAEELPLPWPTLSHWETAIQESRATLARKTADQPVAEMALQRQCQDALAELTPWQGHAEDLEQVILPSEEEILAFQGRLQTVRQRESQARKAREAKHRELTLQQERLQGFLQAGKPVTRGEVSQARERRDQDWQLLLESLLQEGPLTPTQQALSRFWQKLVEADRLVDLLENQSGRAAEYDLLLRTIHRLEEECAALEEERRFAGDAREKEESRWRQALAAPSLAALEPQQLAQWKERRSKALQHHQSLKRLQAENRTQQEEEKRHRHWLNDLLSTLPTGFSLSPEAPLEAWVNLAQDGLNGLKEQHRLAEERRRARAERAALIQQDRQQRQRLGQAEESWRERWAGLAPRLGLPEQAPPELGRQATDRWEEFHALEEKHTALLALKSEVQRRQETYRNRLGPFLTLDPRWPGQAPGEVVEALQKRLLEAQQRDRHAAELSKQFVSLQAERARLTRERDSLQLRLSETIQRFGLPENVEATLAALPHIREQNLKKQALDETREQILAEGEGASLEEVQALVTEVSDTTPPAVRLDEVQEELSRLESDIEATVADIERRRTIQRGRSDNHDAAVVAQERSMLHASLSQAARRWLTVATAQLLLEEGLDHHQEEDATSLLGRASHHFHHLTLGRYRGLQAQWEERGQRRLTALTHPAGECLGVEQLSDGTRDQCFLALRLAGVDWWAQRHEPLPFIADDLLVHFDDRRSQATLERLLDLGSRLQVILFTHHRQLVVQARSLGKESVGVIPLQPQPTDADLLGDPYNFD
ncbi:MAG: AAA family ATPase [Magnetococcales bacterium]|nr:AAA family ATPase [Magnetococcales bacterium]